MTENIHILFAIIGLSGHLFFWYKLTDGELDGWAVALCLISAPAAMVLGPLVIPFEAWLYWLTLT